MYLVCSQTCGLGSIAHSKLNSSDMNVGAYGLNLSKNEKMKVQRLCERILFLIPRKSSFCSVAFYFSAMCIFVVLIQKLLSRALLEGFRLSP